MKSGKLVILFFLLIGGLFSCKKDESNEPDNNTSFDVNLPPTSGSYFVGQTISSDGTKFYASWTTDFETYNIFTNQFTWVGSVLVDNGMLIITELQDPLTALYSIHFASVDDLDNFTTVKSIYSPELITVVNGTVVTYSGSLSRTGYCRTGSGETDVTWTSIPADHALRSLNVFNDEVLGLATIAGNQSYVHITENGTQVQFNVSGFIASAYEVIDNITWGLNANSWGTIASNDWANGTWTTDVFNAILEGNTTSISGKFMTRTNYLIVLSNEWRIYGYIEEDDGQNITRHASVNSSTDNGVTWSTTLLSNIDEGDAFNIVFASSQITLLAYQEQSMNFPIYYSSTDGVNFTKWTDASKIANYEAFGNPMMVR